MQRSLPLRQHSRKQRPKSCCPRCRSCCRAARCEEEEPEVPIVIEENAKIKAAVDYLREVIA